MSAEALGDPALWWALVKNQKELAAIDAQIQALKEEKASLEAQLEAARLEAEEDDA